MQEIKTPLPEKLVEYVNVERSIQTTTPLNRNERKTNEILDYLAELTKVVEALQSPSFREVTSPDLTRGIDISDRSN